MRSEKNVSPKLLVLLLFLPAITVSAVAQADPWPLMPMPAHLQQGTGQFFVNSSFTLGFEGYREPRLDSAAARFLQRLSRQTGIPLPTAPSDSHAKFVIRCRQASAKIQEVGEDESYRLEITSSDVKLEAPNPLGILHGLQTFLQLVQIGPQGFAAPSLIIEDRPRFPWRGLLIDVARHFQPMETLKRNLDAMEAVKLNVLHWHLSEDQGFRVESKSLPKLQERSSDGLYYTQAEVKELIEYARDRGIRIVPEFDMPGHTTSWFAAYPEIASLPGPYQIERKWGIFDPAMDPTQDRTYELVDKFIREMAKLFPDAYFHIGGDEVNGKQWDANPKIQEFMRSHGLKSNEELQAYFSRHLQEIVRKHGKIMVGWDEILDPALPKEAVIQSWRGQDSLADAARRGYRGILSNGYYLDLMYSAASHYLTDPLAAGAANLAPEEKARILGGEACMWSELVTPENIDGRIWPRAAAVAERLWSPAELRDLDSMYARLHAVDDNLQWVGVLDRSNRALMLQRLTGSADIKPLQVLLEVLEPVKRYTRTGTGNYNSSTPLNRLVDAVDPEADKAREFAAMVDRFLAAKSSDRQDEVLMRNWLGRWRDNHSQLQPLLGSSALLKEAAPLSNDLELVAAAGLEALDNLDAGTAPPPEWQTSRLAQLKAAEAPKAELLNMIVPAVEKLVQAAAAH